MCKRLTDTEIYACEMKNVKILDVRFTALGNHMIAYMFDSYKIQELYFQCYGTTYQLDRSRRKLDMHRGSPREPHSYMSDDEENLDTNANRLIKRFGNVPLRSCKTNVVDDTGVELFKNVDAPSIQQERPKSFLYKYPYGECECGYYRNFWDGRLTDEKPKHDYSSCDSDDDDTKQYKQMIRKRRRQLKKALRDRSAPLTYFVVYNMNNDSINQLPAFQWISERPPKSEEEIRLLDHTIVDKSDHGFAVFSVSQCRRYFIFQENVRL